MILTKSNSIDIIYTYDKDEGCKYETKVSSS